MAERVPLGMDCSLQDFKKRAKSEKWLRNCQSNPAASPLDQNKTASGRQLPRRSMGLPQDRDTSQSGYYSEDSDFDYISMTSVATSGASTPMERWTKGTFDRCINHKVTLPKLNDESSMNDQWIWLANVCRYIDSGCSMSILESEIDKSLSNGFQGVWFRMNQMLGDTVEAALNKMMMTNQHQHSDGLLQEFYVMSQRANEPIGKYTMHLNLAAGKMRLQCREALSSNEEERRRLLIDCLLRNMNPKLRGRVAHIVDGKVVHERPDYWHLVKFAAEKEAEINFDETKKVSKPKAMTHF